MLSNYANRYWKMKRFDWLDQINIIALPVNIAFSLVVGNYAEAVAWTVALIWFLGYLFKNES